MPNMNASQDPPSLTAWASKMPIASSVSLPRLLLADDATSADQMALSVCETLGKKVVTTDTRFLSQRGLPVEEGCIWVINSEARAMSAESARSQNHDLATRIFPREKHIPFLQIDSRLRGIRNALQGIYESLDFEFLLFVPAEPELGRLVENGIYYHLEDGRLTPFHQSQLAISAKPPLESSDLRAFIAGELGVSAERVVSIKQETVARGPNAIVAAIRGIRKQDKAILIPDVAGPEHVEAVIAAWKALSPNRILLAGSRTFLRSLFASFADCKAEPPQASLLSQAIDRTLKGAPLAIVASLEPAMRRQIEYAQRGLGPNLVTVVFDSSVLVTDEDQTRREIERVHRLVQEFLKARRPVLLHTSRAQLSADHTFRQKCLDALSRVIARDTGTSARHLPFRVGRASS